METLLYWILSVQVFVSFFVLLPFGEGARNHLLAFCSKQAWMQHVKYSWFGLGLLVGLSCVAHHRSLVQYTELIAEADTFVPAYKEHQLEAERDRNLSGVILLLLLLLQKACSLMQATWTLEKNNEAVTRQLKNASQFAAMQLEESAKMAKKEATKKKDAPADKKPTAEDEQKKKDAGLRKMAEEKEYERVLAENKKLTAANKKLQDAISDYEFMMPGDKKKSD